MKQADTNSIRYPAAVDEKLGKLAQIFKRSKKELFGQMVDYFYRSKKDPEDWGDEALKKELSSGISRILSFIRQQEKDFLLPVFTDAGILKTSATRHTEFLEAIARLLLEETERTKAITERNEKVLSGIKFLVSRQADKETLKQKFSEVLEYYIAQREEMGWMKTTVKKEELVEHVRQSLENL